ncbi:hypothetical protein TEQG_08631 [Trichophyton equinum CBS 127.97]|uniref:Exosome complex exonuclease RRP44 S1 domain-containing protein n=1 Tax=Trichophyton equinum (strain ATCC MYA-4606 / CBS 127.97) TaxID=559882 RepID=F2PNB5_TRIEC|nr:hypothetical protein TEQG_08631 [Trichophyton equinum CBS 127.97]
MPWAAVLSVLPHAGQLAAPNGQQTASKRARDAITTPAHYLVSELETAALNDCLIYSGIPLSLGFISISEAPGVDEEGYVMRVFDNGVVVFIPRFGIEGVVRLEDFVLDAQQAKVFDPSASKQIAARRESEFDNEQYSLKVWEKEGDEGDEGTKLAPTSKSMVVELFDKVKVNVSSVKEEKGRGAGKRRVRVLILEKA